MADTNIIGSLFGVSPDLLQTQQDQRAFTQGMSAGSNPLGGVLGNIGMFSSRAGAGLRGALGVQNPEEQMNAIRQQASTQFNTATPEGMLQYAQFLNQQGDAAGAQQAVIRAQAMAKEAQAIATSRAQQIRAEREPGQLNFQQLLSSGKYTPASVAKFQQSQNPADLVLVKGAAGEGDGAVGPGPVGKAGAFRDVDGNILGATEMKNVRTEFTEGQKLLKLLNEATAKDIKDAESFVDWTTAGVTKGLASSKTLNAQTKLAAAQLVEQIGNLPPGSASDADMRASMKSFPGYSDPESLRQWVNRTKSKLQSRMEDISGQFGFQQRTVSSGEIKFDKPSAKTTPTAAAPAAPQDADSLVNKYLTPKK
jgi:hypothetical protein